jgi:surface antigen
LDSDDEVFQPHNNMVEEFRERSFLTQGGHMKKMYTVLLLAATIALTSCTGQVTRGQSGAGIGAAGGAIVGQAIGKSTEATLIGMAVGATLGYIVGNEMDKADRQQLNVIYERGPSGQPSSWQNPDSGNRYTVVPQPAVETPSGPCRKAEIHAIIDGRSETTYSTACRDASGQWILQ